MKMKRRVKERGRRMTRKAERRTEGRGKGERRKRGNEGKNNKDGRREKEKEERSGKSGAGGSKHSMGEGSPYLGAWEREAALCPCHPSPCSCTPRCYPPHLPIPCPLTELLPESHTRLLRRWRVEARNGGFPERGDEASGCPEPERGG